MIRLRPKIMGIINATPDSFSDGGKFSDVDMAVSRAIEMCEHGADIIDIGGESTRPGASNISGEEEISRILPIIQKLVSKNIKAKISIDTRRPQTAQAAVRAGASIWNDVTGLSFDKNSLKMAAILQCEVVLMHMRGNPQTMQGRPQYKNVTGEVMSYLKSRVSAAVKAGVEREKIILDPGIGFGKRLEDNLDLLQHLDDFHMLGRPLLLGASRKSFIGEIDGSAVGERLGGSIASALWAASMGASIIRVHDVKETVQALKVWQAIGHRANG